jgi:hypothetical protein
MVQKAQQEQQSIQSKSEPENKTHKEPANE